MLKILSKSFCVIILCLISPIFSYGKSAKKPKYAILGAGKNSRKIIWDSFTHYQEGVKLLKKQEKEKAREKFEKAISLDSSYLEPFFYLGNIYIEKKDIQKAKNYFKKAYNLDSKNPDVMYSLGLCSYYQNDIKQSIKYLKGAYRLKPSDTNIQNLLNSVQKKQSVSKSKGLMKRGKYKESIDFLSKAILSNSTSPELYHLRAQSYIQTKDFLSATLDLERASTKTYQPASLFFDKGYIYYQQGRYKKSADSFHKALSIDPSSFQSLFYLGNIYLSRNSFGEAIKYLEKSLAYDPFNPEILYGLGVSYSNIGKGEKALFYLKKANKKAPKDSRIKKLMGNLEKETNKDIQDGIRYMGIKKYKKAMNSFSQAMKKFPDFGRIYHLRAQALIRLNFFSTALEDLNEALDKDYYNSLLLSDLGYTYYQLGEYAKAVKSFGKALKMDPENKQAHDFLEEISEGSNLFNNGIMHFDAKDYEKAIESFSQAILNAPDNYKSYNLRGLSFIRIGDLESALEDFFKALKLNKKK